MNKTIIFFIILIFYLIYKNKEGYEYTPDELFSSLSYISNILQKNNIKYWLCYGTLLGAIRENDIISYDYDFDLGCLITDYDRILAFNKYKHFDSMFKIILFKFV